MQMCDINRGVTTWNRELEWDIKKFEGKTLLSVILRMASGATIYIYWIWLERNAKDYIQEFLNMCSSY